MKLSEYRGEDALDILAELIEPAVEIFTDDEVKNKFVKDKKESLLPLVKVVIKKHKKSVIKILAVLDGEDVASYEEKVNVFTLPVKLLEVLNDTELVKFFTSQVQMVGASASSLATPNIKVAEKE